MKRLSDRGPVTLMAVILIGCSSANSSGDRNQEAIKIHNAMAQRAIEVSHTLDKLKGDSTVSKDSVDLFSEVLQQWRHDLVEVPGNDVHDALHDHSHHPVETLDLTDEQTLAIQKELDQRLMLIQQRVHQLQQE